MTLSPVRLAILQGWPRAEARTASVRGKLMEQVLLLSPELPQAERDEAVDVLALFSGLPIHVAARASDLPTGHLCVVTEPVEGEVRSVEGSIVVGVHARRAGDRRIEASHELRLLRDAVVLALGMHYEDTPLEIVAIWAVPVSDSPSLALCFASAVMARWLADSHAPDEEVYAAGLAATVAWLLRGVDVRVAQWALARALPSKQPGRLVDTEAAVLGEDAALQRAFAAGLLEGLPEEGAPLDLRRPLHLLGHPGERRMDVDFEVLARELRAALAPEVYVVVARFVDAELGARARRIGLAGTAPPRDFVGRAEVLKRLRALFDPADMVRTTVLYGIEGSGRSAVAAALCELLGATLEPVWITFAGGAEGAWVPVANALEVKVEPGPNDTGVPGWVRRVHALVRERACLVVATDVEEIAEARLPGWLPAGPGVCAVLVLSRSSQRGLQREGDAIAVPLKGLPFEEAKELLARKAPKRAEEIREGKADELLRWIDGHPGALGLAGALLEKQSIEEVEALAGRREAPLRALADKAIAALDEEETRLARAMAVCAPVGSPRELPLGMAGVEAGVLVGLEDKALLVTRGQRVRLHGVVRLGVEGGIEEEEEARLQEAHARKALEMFRAAQGARSFEAEDNIYEDALLGLEHMTARCRRRADGVADVVMGLAGALLVYPRGDAAERIGGVIAGYRAALTIYTKEDAPDEWRQAQNSLSLALQGLPIGNRASNLQEAIDGYRAILAICTQEDSPQDWAGAQNNIGNALVTLPIGDKAEHLRAAIDAYRAALDVWTKETHPQEWAAAQSNLGAALRALPSGDKAENLRQAIGAYHAALTVRTKATDPNGWAMTQNNLGNALAGLPTGDNAENLRQAIDAYQAALTGNSARSSATSKHAAQAQFFN